MSINRLLVVLFLLASAGFQIYAVTKQVGLYNNIASPLKPTFDEAEINQPFSVRDWNGIVNAVSAFVGIVFAIVLLSGSSVQLFMLGGLVILSIFQIVGASQGANILSQIPSDVSIPGNNPIVNQITSSINNVLDTTRMGYYYPYVGSVFGAVVSLVSTVLLGIEWYSGARLYGARRS